MSHTSASYAATAPGALRAGNGKVMQLVSKAYAWIAEQRRVNRTAATLSSLSDATLRDIGIERGDIQRVARHGRWA